MKVYLVVASVNGDWEKHHSLIPERCHAETSFAFPVALGSKILMSS